MLHQLHIVLFLGLDTGSKFLEFIKPLLSSGFFICADANCRFIISFMNHTAEQLALIYENICSVCDLIGQRIEDECDSSEDFGNHYLANEYSLLRKSRSNFENLINGLLQKSTDADDIRNELSKLCVEAALRSKPLKIAKFIKSS
jgi:hypothetical protein